MSTSFLASATTPTLPTLLHRTTRRLSTPPCLSTLRPPIRSHTTTSPPSPPPSSKSFKPGLAEDAHFPPSPNTLFWRAYKPPATLPSLTRCYTHHARYVSLAVAQNTHLMPYWLFATCRLGFFAPAPAAVLLSGMFGNFGGHKGVMHSMGGVAKRTLQVLSECVFTFGQDFESVVEGCYKMPWDMSLGHRQNDPTFVLREVGRFAADVPRYVEGIGRGGEDMALWMESAVVPRYYQQRYHFQTDGWMSSESAAVYELSTEVLFTGRQDAMQRATLLPIARYVRECGGDGDGAGLRFLELGAGTGRFATFVRDNWPGAEYTLSDLSPFYLEKARENMRYWELRRGGGGGGDRKGGVRFLQAAAERMAVGEGEVDVVYCVYLFHELPPEVRRRVVGEVERVLRVGGLFVMTDSTQLGDILNSDKRLPKFGKLNEPWYESYIQEDLVQMVCRGRRFEPMMKEVRSTSKTLAFRKVA